MNAYTVLWMLMFLHLIQSTSKVKCFGLVTSTQLWMI